MRRKATPDGILTPFNAKAKGKDHSDSSAFPIIIFTGIHGRELEVNDLAAAIDKLHLGKAPIYICRSSFPDNCDPKTVADEILRVRNNSQNPYTLIGFSYGTLLAAKVSEILQYEYDHQYIPIPIGLDQPAPNDTLEFLDSDAPSANRTLLSIVNLPATIAGLAPLVENADTFAGFELYFASRKIEALADNLLNQQPQASPESVRLFNEQLEVVKQNLAHLVLNTPYFKRKLKSGNFIFTQETIEKQSSISQGSSEPFTAGWDKCCETVQILRSEDGDVELLSHLDLVSKDHVDKVAALITACMNQEIKLALKTIAPRVIKKAFGGTSLSDDYIKALETIIPPFVRNSYQSLNLDEASIAEISKIAIKQMVLESQHNNSSFKKSGKLTGQFCNQFTPRAKLRQSQGDNAPVTPIALSSNGRTSPHHHVKVK